VLLTAVSRLICGYQMVDVERWNSEEEMVHDMKDRGFFPSRYTFPPGRCFPPHRHDHDKNAAVVSGEIR
jgi:quercetin dioxygenase-like cupin family protein